MSYTTITPEERGEIRRLAVSTGILPGKTSMYKKLEQLLSALEWAEAENARLTKMVDWLANVLIGYGDENEEMSAADWKEAARRAVAESEVKG